MTAGLYVTARIRKSPFFDAALKAGASTLSVYNKTYLPGDYAGMEPEFWSLVNDVTLWDVTCQRVVQVSGPDASRFIAWVTPRDLSQTGVGQCRYVILTTPDGGILNDPVLMRMDEQCYWLSSADGDVAMWLRGVSVNAGFEVDISWPEVATLQLQGPRSVDVLRDLLGDSIEELGYYRHAPFEIAGIAVTIARTGWSAERGYELYLRDLTRGEELWDRLMQAGQPYRIAPASPSRIRRIEAGIPDYSVDMDVSTNPFEVGLARLVDTTGERDYIGRQALLRVARDGVTRRLVGIEIEGARVEPNDVSYPVLREQRQTGRMTSWVYSPRLERNIGLAMVETGCEVPGVEFTIDADGGERHAHVVACPFVDPERRLPRR